MLVFAILMGMSGLVLLYQSLTYYTFIPLTCVSVTNTHNIFVLTAKMICCAWGIAFGALGIGICIAGIIMHIKLQGDTGKIIPIGVAFFYVLVAVFSII